MFDIKPLVPPSKSKWPYPTLPDPPFRLCVYAPSNSGKSVMLSNLISSPEFPYRDIFGPNIFIVSPTFKLGSIAGMDNVKPENVFDEFIPEQLQAIINEQADLMIKYPKRIQPFLLVLDDVAADLNSSQKQFLKRIFFGLRHYHGSVAILSQQFRALPKPVRMNASDSIFFEISNSGELKDIGDESPYPNQQMLDVLEFATTVEPYSFLVVRHKKPKEQRLQLRFTNTILK